MPTKRELTKNAADELALNAAWVVLRLRSIPDGLLGVFYMEAVEAFVLHYEEDGCPYAEWVRVNILNLELLPVDVLEEAALRLAKRIAITRRRFVDPRRNLEA